MRYSYQRSYPAQVNAPDNNNDRYWLAGAPNAAGQVTDATLGEVTNGVTFKITCTYDKVTQMLKARHSVFTSGAVSGAVIANLGFLYEKVGN